LGNANCNAYPLHVAPLVVFDVQYESRNGVHGSDDNLLSKAQDIKSIFSQGKVSD